MRLVDADALLSKMEKYSDDNARSKNEYLFGMQQQLETCIELVEDAPTVDAVPVRHGRWIKKRYWSEGAGMGERYGYYYSCSKCGNLVRGGYDECDKKYCDECGARMDGKEGDQNG